MKKAKKKTARGGSREGSGRKKIHPEGETVMLTARVPGVLVTQLDEHAEKLGITRSQAVADAIRAVLKTP